MLWMSLPKLTIQLGRLQWSERLLTHRVGFGKIIPFVYIYRYAYLLNVFLGLFCG